MVPDLSKKVVVVTGAAGSLGREICSSFLELGADLIAVDRIKLEKMQEASPAGKGREKGRFCSVPIDLCKPESVQEGCRAILKRFPEVDVLVNNAALYGGLKLTPMDSIDLQEWDEVMGVNLRGAYLMTRHLLPGLKRARGSVVNVASAAALRGSPNLLHYVVSKGGLLAMSRALANELGSFGIRVNSVAPGLIDSESSRSLGAEFESILKSTVNAQAIKERMRVADVVGSILFLSVEWSRAVTGQTVVVDRGLVKS